MTARSRSFRAKFGKFYPYGIERPSATTNGTEKFTGYFRDAESGNDYANQRFISPGYGRFLTPDRSGHPSAASPGSWNRYAYAGGDPINRVDPSGNDAVCVGGVLCFDDGGYGPDGACALLAQQFEAGTNPEADMAYILFCGQSSSAGPGNCGGVLSFPDSGCDSGGGGGGSPSGPGSPGNGFAPGSTAPRLSGMPSSIQAIFNAAWQVVLTDLSSPKCDSVYTSSISGGLPLTSAQLLTTFVDATYQWSYCLTGTAVDSAKPACTNRTTQTVTINEGGAFGNPATTGVKYPVGPNGTNLPTTNAMVFALLHELGHLEGIDADANKYNNPFNIGILTNCMGVKVK